MAFTKFNAFLTQMASGGSNVHNLSTAVFKVYLSNEAPSVTADSLKANLAEIPTGGGYSGAVTIPIDSRGIEDNEYVIAPTGPIVWTGTGAGFGPLQYAVLFNDSGVGKPLIGFWDYPTQITLVAADETLTLNITTGGGLLKLI